MLTVLTAFQPNFSIYSQEIKWPVHVPTWWQRQASAQVLCSTSNSLCPTWCHPLRFPARLDQCWPVTDRSGLHRSHLSQTHSAVHVTCSPRLVLAHLRDRLNGHPGLSTLSAPCPSPTWPSPCCLKMDLTHNLKVWLCLEEENRHTWFAHDHKWG